MIPLNLPGFQLTEKIKKVALNVILSRIGFLYGFILVLALVASFLLRSFEKEVRENAGNAAESVLHSTHQAIRHIWLERYFDFATMFVVTPLMREDVHILAALGFKLDPFLDFTLIANTGSFGTSGETYFIDEAASDGTF
jgi:hypothetical protein